MGNKKNVSLNPYLTFSGNCREAMTFYKECMNGELEINLFEGAPMEVPQEWKNKIMHATLKFDDAVIMASDSMPGQEVKNGNSIRLSISAQNLEVAERIFNNLARGGKITMSFEKTFWGAQFGMLIDKFGIHWMINCELK